MSTRENKAHISQYHLHLISPLFVRLIDFQVVFKVYFECICKKKRRWKSPLPIWRSQIVQFVVVVLCVCVWMCVCVYICLCLCVWNEPSYRPQGKVMFSQACVRHSVHNWPHGYSVTAHPCYGAVSMHAIGTFLFTCVCTRMGVVACTLAQVHVCVTFNAPCHCPNFFILCLINS